MSEPVKARCWFPCHDRLLMFSLFVFLGLVGCLWGLNATVTLTKVKATPYDFIAIPKAKVRLQAKFEIDGPGLLNPDLKRKKVSIEFTDKWHAAAAVVTDKEGIASLEVDAPEQKGAYKFSVALAEDGKFVLRDNNVSGTLFVLDPEARILITDIDETITAGDGWKSLMNGPGPDPLPGAAETLTKLSETHTIVYLTARDDALLNDTRMWLQVNKFPTAGPVLCRDWTLFNASMQGQIKLKSLQELKESFKWLVCGIGNIASDCMAYREAGISHITLGKSDCPGHGPGTGCMEAKDWAAVRAILIKPPEKSQ